LHSVAQLAGVLLFSYIFAISNIKSFVGGGTKISLLLVTGNMNQATKLRHFNMTSFFPLPNAFFLFLAAPLLYRWLYKTMKLILIFYSNDDYWKVLDENVRIFNSIFQGYSNQKKMNLIFKA